MDKNVFKKLIFGDWEWSGYGGEAADILQGPAIRYTEHHFLWDLNPVTVESPIYSYLSSEY